MKQSFLDIIHTEYIPLAVYPHYPSTFKELNEDIFACAIKNKVVANEI